MNTTNEQRIIIEDLVTLWQTGQPPRDLDQRINLLARKDHDGQQAADFLKEVLVKLAWRQRRAYAFSDAEGFRRYLIDTVSRIHDDALFSPKADAPKERDDALTRTLLASISGTVSDYRKGEIPAISLDHVERWVRQFADDAQLTILEEMDRILKTHYVSQARAKQLLAMMFAIPEIFGSSVAERISETSFLDIQKRGSSQRDLLALVADMLPRQHGVRLGVPSKPRQYIYLDDCLFTGSRVYHDIEAWAPTANAGSTLHIILLGAHTKGIQYTKRRVADACARQHVQLKMWVARSFIFQNEEQSTQEYDCLWPTHGAPDAYAEDFASYVEQTALKKGWPTRLFRPREPWRGERVFSSAHARNVVEQAFLKAGAYICSLPASRQANMRPMGYELLETLGFGGLFVSYRNIANNCPLALWWGVSAPKWFPLFPRKINEATGNYRSWDETRGDYIPF